MATYTSAAPKQGGAKVILEKGEYPFEVVDATESVSANGNDKIELKLRVNGEANVYDNLVFTEKAFWKIDQFLRSVDAHPGEGNTVDVTADECIGHKGVCFITVGKNDKGEPRNEVGGYVWDDQF